MLSVIIVGGILIAMIAFLAGYTLTSWGNEGIPDKYSPYKGGLWFTIPSLIVYILFVLFLSTL